MQEEVVEMLIERLERGEGVGEVVRGEERLEGMMRRIGVRSEEDVLGIGKCMRYAHITKKQVVIKQNTKNHLKVFFLLRGSMLVLKDDLHNLDHLQDHEKLLLLKLHLLAQHPSTPSNPFSPSFKHSSVFGGQALLSPSSRRIREGSFSPGRNSSLENSADQEQNQSVIDKLMKLERDFALMENNYKSLEAAQKTIDDLLPDGYSDALMKIVLSAVLGKAIRVLEPGDICGEKALDSYSARSASVVAITDCDVMTLSAEDYTMYVKMKAKAVRDQKHQLLVEKFPFYSKMPQEDLWKFAYLFQVMMLAHCIGEQVYFRLQDA